VPLGPAAGLKDECKAYARNDEAAGARNRSNERRHEKEEHPNCKQSPLDQRMVGELSPLITPDHEADVDM
jgi:hypothetical protein